MGYGGVDRYTFRGKFLDDARDIIGKKLYHRAWERMPARELHDYGEALLEAGRKYARKHKLEYLTTRAGTRGSSAGTHFVALAGPASMSYW